MASRHGRGRQHEDPGLEDAARCSPRTAPADRRMRGHPGRWRGLPFGVSCAGLLGGLFVRLLRDVRLWLLPAASRSTGIHQPASAAAGHHRQTGTGTGGRASTPAPAVPWSQGRRAVPWPWWAWWRWPPWRSSRPPRRSRRTRSRARRPLTCRSRRSLAGAAAFASVSRSCARRSPSPPRPTPARRAPSSAASRPGSSSSPRHRWPHTPSLRPRYRTPC